jgi:hypothetical protein
MFDPRNASRKQLIYGAIAALVLILIVAAL